MLQYKILTIYINLRIDFGSYRVLQTWKDSTVILRAFPTRIAERFIQNSNVVSNIPVTATEFRRFSRRAFRTTDRS
jgi:hypothetical protein